MLNFLKQKKSKAERLKSKYERLMAEGHRLFSTNYELSIKKYVKAQSIINQIPLQAR